jgi:hypothetical protein
MIIKNTYKRIMIGFLFLLLFSNMAYASDSIQLCLSNTTLQKNNSIYYNNTWYNFTERITCNNGCDLQTNSCAYPDYLNKLIIITIFGLIIILFYIIFKKIKRL